MKRAQLIPVVMLFIVLVLGYYGMKYLHRSDEIYAPLRVTCWDTNTGKVLVENTAFGGITFGSGWFRTTNVLLDYEDTNKQRVTIDLANSRCAVAAYRDDVK